MDYRTVELKGDARGRVNISALNSNGYGHGYRLAGPKYTEDRVRGVVSPETFRVELGAVDVDELHVYLRIWDEINLDDGRGGATVWLQLVEASDRYRKAETTLQRVQSYPVFPAERYVELEQERDQAKARLVDAARKLVEAWSDQTGTGE